MKCTDCREVIKPVIAIDIDGTLGDYHNFFTRFVESYYNFTIHEPYDGRKPFKEWFADRGVDIHMYRQAKLAYRQGGLKRNMPLLPDPFHHTLPAGTEVWIATTRPYLRLDNIDPDTRFWLERIGMKYDGMLYGEDKYEMLCDRVGKERIAFILDDLPEQYDMADELGLPVWQIVRHHNSAPVAQRPRRVYASNVPATIEKAVAEWQSKQTSQNGHKRTPASGFQTQMTARSHPTLF